MRKSPPPVSQREKDEFLAAIRVCSLTRMQLMMLGMEIEGKLNESGDSDRATSLVRFALEHLPKEDLLCKVLEIALENASGKNRSYASVFNAA